MTRETETEDERHVSRRRYIALTGAVGVAGVAGCAGDDPEEDLDLDENGEDEDDDEDDAETEPEPAEEGDLEIVHWWTAGGEEEAYNALLDGFREQHPDVEIVDNPAPGGAGSAIDAVIQNRVLDGNPPSTFQIWPGQALTPYTDADLLEDIGDTVWSDEMRDAYLDDIVDLSRPDGDLVAVPINIHRMNNLFYNVDVIEDAGVDPAAIEDPDELLDVLGTVADETGVAALAHQTQSPWSSLQLWEDVFLGQHGVDAYTSFVDGDVDALEDEIRESLSLLADYADYYPEDAGSISWDQGNSQLIAGDAAFIHQGDWAAGQYRAEDGFEFGDSWDMVPFPGTDGVYHSVIDSFVFPTNNPSPDATEQFLQYAGSVDAQERFNPIKGSIPPRTDVPTDDLGPFLTRQFEDFGESTAQPPTIAHGTAAPPAVHSELEEAFANFNENLDVDQAFDAISNAF
ncbi:ABC-type sugar transport system, periplasmic component [Halalkaliarchaeum sp. AArc-CO]|uniref:ABC transporter substrate-binding protein n=1 Tax=unclassified Halalkaliarchaeum TaxID=2678344 RepID=UPI00217EA6A2|nr:MULTISPECIES: ABC transporter substrate-binding protein [unclassified Halalkaliarchaeum]MDR5673324.1 ABC transporter substrate-binding protein [Halalkaliarchaeum sp. AArc-GB]UWG49665.1 ABC-type sugar transport system, periplasmic component [Halalkaliarchaeum sp. AArc-CO]